MPLSMSDPLRVVEAGYHWASDEREWLSGIAEAARPFAIGEGVAAYTVELAERAQIRAYSGTSEVEARARAFTSAFDLATARQVYAPTEFVGNATYRVRRLAKLQKKSVRDLTRGKHISAFALVSGDPRTQALALVFPSEREAADPDRAFPHARVLGLAAAHLSAALRLRALAAGSPDDADSVLAPNGRVLHAVGAARNGRESLVEAVVRRERARGRLRRSDPDEAARMWSVLVAGRWSIVDFVDRDGKRLLLARRNPVHGPDVLALSDEERDVVWLATLGHSRKYIAYELGLAAATVTKRLGSAQRKLRVKSRRELLRKLGHV